MQKRVFASLAALTLGVSACGPAIQPLVPGAGNGTMNLFGKAPRRAGQAKWTVMVHLAADNNLYRFGLEDVNEMEAGLNSPDVNVIVLFDGSPKGDSAIYKIKKDPGGKNTTIISDKVDDGGAIIPANKEIDSGNVDLNAKFAAWAVKNFPAERYAQFHWDHGSGIFGLKGRSFPTKGFGWDDNGGHMSTKDINTLLGAAAQAAGKPVEAYGFDACLMGHTELAYQAKGLANFLVASEELEPGPGWDYQGWVGALSANPDMDGGGLGTAMVDSYIKSYKPGGSQNPGGRTTDATLSAVNINALTSGLVPAMNQLAADMSAAYGANKAVLDDVRKRTGTFDNTDCADFGHFLKLAKAANLPESLKASVAATEAQYSKSVVANGTVGSAQMANGTGMVVYFPRPDQAYNPVYSDPNKIAFGAENWKAYLKASHGQSFRGRR